ncbi:hypothetical protein Scep_029171 [Stephania cephalantha]|uniref:RNA polymerase II C-terminal domain phosphatase-like n=1 Tax=Stephania cephalantha TaxID=152367 RepID=A0AAP0E044_9MAGN
MSSTTDSVHSVSSDEFATLIEKELEWNSSEDEDDIESDRIKRRKVEELDNAEESQEATSIAMVPQTSDGAVNLETCLHQAPIFGGMCSLCGQFVKDHPAVSLGYIHKHLKVGTEEMNRIRGSDLKSLLRGRKLILVLDLDHTLLNSTRIDDVSAEEEHLIKQADSLQDIPNGSLFKVDMIRMLTKLRPFVRTFLKEASSLFELFIYTMGERFYATWMAKLLDPEETYFNEKVISKDDCTQEHRKSLDVVLGADNAVLILDDTEAVWSRHKENLILMDRYHFFASSGRPFGHSGKSLSELKRDENEKDGALATVLEVLKRIHEMFFTQEYASNPTNADVRKVLKKIRAEVLKDCRLVFSRVWKLGERPHSQRLWEMAQQLGATCDTELDESVTHVVSTDTGTEKARWAVQHNKFLVHPRWIEAANYLWRRQPEEQFSVNQIKK